MFHRLFEVLVQSRSNELRRQIGFRAPVQTNDTRALDPPAVGAIRCEERLGGVIRHYYR